MKLIRFIAISVFCLCSYGHATACADNYTPAHCYMFSVYNHNLLTAWNESIQKKHTEFWTSYFANKSLGKYIHDFLYPSDSKAIRSLIRYAQSRRDYDGTHYLMQMNKVQSIAAANPWNYPSPKELQRGRQIWISLLNDASARINRSKKLGSRYWLMAMRAAYYTNNRKRCQQLWDKYQSKFEGDYIRDLAQGYIASYWFKDGQREKAREYYAHVGDLESLRWCFNGEIGLRGIMKLYAEAPNSVAFPYLIQDYVNSMDNDWLWNHEESGYEISSSDSIRNVLISEMRGFRQFTAKVIKEKKIGNAALWQSAAAFFAYLLDDKKTAINELADADKMEGTDRMKDNIRAIRFLIASDTSDYNSNFDKYVLTELKWLINKSRSEEAFEDYNEPVWIRNHYGDVIQRIVYYHLTPNYIKNGQFTTGALLTGMTSEYIDQQLCQHKHFDKVANPEKDDNYLKAQDFSNNIFALLDTASVNDVVDYAKLLENPSKGNELQQFAASICYNKTDYYNELIGTKYMRIENFAKAHEYFKKVSLAYMSSMSIAPYMHTDNTQPLWLKWRSLKQLQALRYIPSPLTTNPKDAFCTDMLALQQRLALTTDSSEKSDVYYQMAVKYAQASHLGYSWQYLHYRWSIDMKSVESYKQERYLDQARSFLNKSMALNATDNNKVRCLFALASISETPWREYEYDMNDKPVYHLDSEQAKAFKQLKNLQSSFQYQQWGLSKCDNLKAYYLYASR